MLELVSLDTELESVSTCSLCRDIGNLAYLLVVDEGTELVLDGVDETYGLDVEVEVHGAEVDVRETDDEVEVEVETEAELVCVRV